MGRIILPFSPVSPGLKDAPCPAQGFVRLDVLDDAYAHIGFFQGAVLIVQRGAVVNGRLHYVEAGGHGFLARIDRSSGATVRVTRLDRQTAPKTYLRAKLAEIGVVLTMPEPAFSGGIQRLQWSTDGEGFHVDTEEMRRWVSMFGGDPEAWEGWGWADFLHPEDKEAFIARWMESLETGRPYLNHGRILLGGVWCYIVVAANLTRDASGKKMWRGFMDIEAIEERQTA